jgi:hypothetical protein
MRTSAAAFATPRQAHIHQRRDVAAGRVLRTVGQDRPSRRGQFALEPIWQAVQDFDLAII